MADGTPVNYGGGWINQELRNIELNIAGYLKRITLDIIMIKYNIMLGMAWLQTHNPDIN